MGTNLEENVKQFKLRVPEELLSRITQLSERYNRRSVNQVIVDVLTYYLDFWEQAEQARLNKISEQRVSVADLMAQDRATASTPRPVDTFMTEPLKIPIIGITRAPERPKATGKTTHPRTKSKGSKKS